MQLSAQNGKRTLRRMKCHRMRKMAASALRFKCIKFNCGWGPLSELIALPRLRSCDKGTERNKRKEMKGEGGGEIGLVKGRRLYGGKEEGVPIQRYCQAMGGIRIVSSGTTSLIIGVYFDVSM